MNKHGADQGIHELRKNKIAAFQETRWTKSTPQVFVSNEYSMYTSSLTNKHEFGFFVGSKVK
jgi:hypothetical protein